MVIGLAAFAVAAVAAWVVFPRAPELPGTSLDGVAAPGFRLTDHRGVSIGLDDFRGRPVVLAFLYTNCPDVCKLTAAGLHQTVDLLGSDAANVQLLAVSVDPGGDDSGSVRRFLGRYSLADRMLYLTGPPDELSTVWKSYYLYVDGEQARQARPAYDAHTDALYLIDKRGRERSLLHSDFDPTELAAALRQLAAERA